MSARRRTRRSGLAALGALALIALPAAADTVVLELPAAGVPDAFDEPSALSDPVGAGELPPVTERLPAEPLVVPPNETRSLGEYGGDWNMLVGRSKDVRLLVVYGYARLA